MTADPILHPYYGWHEVSRGFSWRKLRLYYGEPHRRPSFWRLLIGPFVLLYGFTVFLVGGRGLGTFALVGGSTLIAYWCVEPFISSLVRCWQTTALINSPPQQVSSPTGDLRRLRTSPTLVVGNRIAVNASVLDIDRSATPPRIYTKGMPGSPQWLGAYHRIGATGEEVIVHHVGSILGVAGRTNTPVEHLLATHVLHELAHWALEEENDAIHADHAGQWNRVLAAEVSYVTGDSSPLRLMSATGSEGGRVTNVDGQRTQRCG